MPNAPEVKNPQTAAARVRAAGTMTGLKMMNTGMAKARPIRVPVRMRPARKRKNPPIGTPVTIAKIWDLEGPFSGRMLLKASVGRWTSWSSRRRGWCSAIVGEKKVPHEDISCC